MPEIKLLPVPIGARVALSDAYVATALRTDSGVFPDVRNARGTVWGYIGDRCRVYWGSHTATYSPANLMILSR